MSLYRSRGNHAVHEFGLPLVHSASKPMLRLGIRLFVVSLYTLACFYWLGLYVGFFGVWIPPATHYVSLFPTGFFTCVAPA